MLLLCLRAVLFRRQASLTREKGVMRGSLRLHVHGEIYSLGGDCVVNIGSCRDFERGDAERRSVGSENARTGAAHAAGGKRREQQNKNEEMPGTVAPKGARATAERKEKEDERSERGNGAAMRPSRIAPAPVFLQKASMPVSLFERRPLNWFASGTDCRTNNTQQEDEVVAMPRRGTRRVTWSGNERRRKSRVMATGCRDRRGL